MFGPRSEWLRVTAVVCAILVIPGDLPLPAQAPATPPATPPAAPKEESGAPKTADQLDSLVAPIALYPDPLLAQVLAASTYPLEIVQAQRWLTGNSTLKGEELTKAAAKQPWDASVQALVAFPDALKFLDKNIQWTTDLGNAFLDQQTDVMSAVQRMRKKAKDSGKLESSKEQKVEVKTVEQKTVIEIQPSNPEVIYVPSYNPTVVYGAPPVAYYPYPPIVYPPPPVYSTGAVVATAAISFGVGVAMGAFWGGCCGGGYGWGCSWGGSANININNNFNTRYGYNNVNNINSGNRGGNSNWQHNPQHRQSVPYGNRQTAQRFGGSARDAGGGLQRFDRNGQARNNGVGDRGGIGDRGGVGDRGGAGNNRGGVGDRGGVGGGGGVGDRGGAGGDRVGNRSVGNQSGQRSALGGGESRSRAEASSNRGFSSSRSSGGGGGARSGGARSGGGGGRRR